MTGRERARGLGGRVFEILQAASRPGGLRRLRRGIRPRQHEAYSALRDTFGLDLRTILYVGANVGQDLPVMAEVFPDAKKLGQQFQYAEKRGHKRRAAGRRIKTDFSQDERQH